MSRIIFVFIRLRDVDMNNVTFYLSYMCLLSYSFFSILTLIFLCPVILRSFNNTKI
jgi:hypothetical protein